MKIPYISGTVHGNWCGNDVDLYTWRSHVYSYGTAQPQGNEGLRVALKLLAVNYPFTREIV